jgi:uncharacterized protein YlxW (UPF0749 family)
MIAGTLGSSLSSLSMNSFLHHKSLMTTKRKAKIQEKLPELPELSELVERYQTLQQKIKRYTDEKEELKERIVAKMGAHTKVQVDEWTLQQISSKRQVAAKADFPPEIWSKYARAINYSCLRCQKSKK